MGEPEGKLALHGGKKLGAIVLFCVLCVALDFLGARIADATGLPIYFDSLGIILASAFCGYIPGIVVAYLTNLVNTLYGDTSIYFCLTCVLIAVAAGRLSKRGWFQKMPHILGSVVILAIVGGGVGSIITWFLGSLVAENVTAAAFFTRLGTDLLWDLLDKAVMVALAVAIMKLAPDSLKKSLVFTFWQQTPLEGDELNAAWRTETRKLSLRTKIVGIVAVVMIVMAVVTTAISYIMYDRSNFETQCQLGEGIAELEVNAVDGDMVNLYLEYGSRAAGYYTTNRALMRIRDSFPEVEYVYVYQIKEDGCHVVFDPDTVDANNPPGEVVPFDPAFDQYRQDLLDGKEIEPVVSYSEYGWLLTLYRPVFDKDGNCTCYVGVDISMERLMADQFAYLVRVVFLFAAFFILICAIVIWLAEYGLIMPINSIAQASGNFAFDTERSREEGADQLRKLNVRTGDEIENLYQAVTKTSEDTVTFIADAQEKAATIERMQDNLILVMADLVESRDQFTGDHVRKTAAYTKIIMDEMRREGMYPDVLTDDFVNNVVKSAPLHDIGKIEVSDTILNKPGRLTDEEFEIMRHHTIAGENILEEAKGAMSDGGYLDEARRLAAYHHEKWNGEGYPYGISGEDIPLSARIMAVADVFDALVSKRSYKDGMPIEKALDIIRKDAGTHFDPQVAKAFLNAEAEARRIAAEHGDAQGTAADIREEKPEQSADAPE